MTFGGRGLETRAWELLCKVPAAQAQATRQAVPPPLPEIRCCERCKEETRDCTLGQPGSGHIGRWVCKVCWRRSAHKIKLPQRTLAIKDTQAAQRPRSGFQWLYDRTRRLYCSDCAGSLSLAVRIDLLDGYRGHKVCEDWLCPSCWLACPRASDPHAEVARTNLGFECLQQVMLLRAAGHAALRDEPEPTSKASDPPDKLPWPAEPPAERLLLFWDCLDRNSSVLARLLNNEFGFILDFVEIHNSPAVLQALQCCPDVPSDELVRENGLSAALRDGIFIRDCEDAPKVLLYEIKYLVTLRPPDLEEVARFEVILKKLNGFRIHNKQNVAAWWDQDEVALILVHALEEHKMCLVDGFLPDGELRALQDTAHRLYEKRHMNQGVSEQRQGNNSFFGPESENSGDFLNIEEKPRKWSVQGDYRIWINDSDPRAPELRLLSMNLDRFISRLRRQSGPAQCSARLRRIHFRENAMVACYPGANRSRYMKHTDTGRKAVMTAILYLNDDWTKEDGGRLRLFHHHCTTRIRYEVAPYANRLLLFWSNEECPHEVRASHRDRFAMTTWLLDGRQQLESEGDDSGGSITRLTNLLSNANVVERDSDDEASAAFVVPEGVDKETARKLRITLACQAEAEAAALRRRCASCGAGPSESSPDAGALAHAAAKLVASGASALSGLRSRRGGRMGDGEYEDHWYCESCWAAWDAEWAEKERSKEEHERLRQAHELLWRQPGT